MSIIDETPVIAQSTMIAYDPAILMERLEEEGTALLQDAAGQCRTANVVPVLRIMHDRTVTGILATAADTACDLIVMGTHGRTGVARMFLGSTTEGVLRSSHIPVLTVRSAHRPVDTPFAVALVAVDDSEPADAAAALVAMLTRTLGTQVITCHAIEPTQVRDTAIAMSYGFVAEKLAADMRHEAQGMVEGVLSRAGLAENTPFMIVEGDPAHAIIAAAEDRRATVIVAGTHGRRGLRRFALGSVAESIVRERHAGSRGSCDQEDQMMSVTGNPKPVQCR